MKLKQISSLSVQGTSPEGGPQGLKEELFRNQFKKTQLCRFYTAGKKCKKGQFCVFAHDASELSVVPDLNKTSLCAAWMAWKCNKSSDACKFAHGSRDLRRTPLYEASQLGKRMPKSRAGLGTPDSNEVYVPCPCPTSLKLTSPPMLASPPMMDIDDVDSPYLRPLTSDIDDVGIPYLPSIPRKSKSTSPVMSALMSDMDQAYSRHSYVKPTPVTQSSLLRPRRQSFSRQTTRSPSPATPEFNQSYMSFSRQTTAWPSPATSDMDEVDTPTQSDIDQVDGCRKAEAPPQPLPAQHWLLSGMTPLITSASMQQRHMLAEMLQSATPEYYED